MISQAESRARWHNPRITESSRWMCRQDGELVVYEVVYWHTEGERENWHITHYTLQREDKSQWKTLTYDTMQKLVKLKRMIDIGEYTKEQWIEMSKN